MSDKQGQTTIKKRYIPSLDGLRALAVIAVIAYHLEFKYACGGLLGVTVFFVLSGYLITGLLIAELEATHTINLGQFWLRRVRRLFPAIVLVILVVTALCVIFNHTLLTKLRPDIIPSLFWFQNWWYVFRGLSYFESLGDPSPLTHFWSLAIEEQFYLIWPLVLLAACKLGAKKVMIRRSCIVLAVISALLMAFLYAPDADPTRIYYGTDTRAFSLLIGAWLSLFWPGQALTDEATKRVSSASINIIDAAGTAALLCIIAMMMFLDGFSSLMYYGGIVLCSLLTAVVIAVIVHPLSRLAKFASLKPFEWVGKRSYGIYLWHYPVILLLKPITGGAGITWWFAIIVFVVTFGVAHLSYTFVENPIRHGAIGKIINRWRNRRNKNTLNPPLRAKTVAPVLATVLTVAIAVGGCFIVPDEYAVPEEAIVSTGEDAGSGMQINEDIPPAYDKENGIIGNAILATDYVKKQLDKAAAEEAEAQRLANMRSPILIGDSVPGDSADQFYSHYTRGLIDTYIGRWFWQARNVYQDYVNQGIAGDVVIFANFTNFVLEDGELDKMLAIAGPDRQIFLVNTYFPKDYCASNNAKLADFAATHENVHLIDWYSTVVDHVGEYLWNDREHLKPDGSKVYQDLIFDNVKGYLTAEQIKE